MYQILTSIGKGCARHGKDTQGRSLKVSVVFSGQVTMASNAPAETIFTVQWQKVGDGCLLTNSLLLKCQLSLYFYCYGSSGSILPWHNETRQEIWHFPLGNKTELSTIHVSSCALHLPQQLRSSYFSELKENQYPLREANAFPCQKPFNGCNCCEHSASCSSKP